MKIKIHQPSIREINQTLVALIKVIKGSSLDLRSYIGQIRK